MNSQQKQQGKKKLNPNPNPKNKMSMEGKKQEFEFCKICNLNHNKGRRHNYFPNHIKSLSSFLSRFLKKLSDVRFFLKNPTLLPENASQNRLWCIFCDSDIEELDSSFACSNAITHLASSEHLKSLKNFLWKYGGAMDQVDSFRISETDLAKWENKCKTVKSAAASASQGSCGPCLVPSKDIHNELSSDNMDYSEKFTIHSFKSSFSNGVLPLQCFTDERYQVSHSEVIAVGNVGSLLYETSSFPVGKHADMDFRGMHVSEIATMDLTDDRESQDPLAGHSQEGLVGRSSSNRGVQRMANGESSNRVLQNITKVSPLFPGEPKGNVHSGAPPPWFETNEENQLNVQGYKGLLVNGLSPHLHKSGRSQKLNPKRVGAAWAEKRKMEMEMEKKGEIVSNTFDADWLPNFGRVWQSGSRKESRKEFEMEKQKLVKTDSQSETMIKMQPYISKRMRRDAGANEGVIDSHPEEIKEIS